MGKRSRRKARVRRSWTFWFVAACFFCITTILLLNLYVFSRPTQNTTEYNKLQIGSSSNSLSVFIKVVQNFVKHPLAYASHDASIKRLKLQSRMEILVTKLQYWDLNSTRLLQIRNGIEHYLNKTNFICTQENTPIGAKYYDTLHNTTIVIDKPRHKMLPEKSPFTTNTHFKTCAVVGNGGILKNSGCGKEIDEHDFVFRCNLQPIRGFEDDAGSKANLTSISQSLLHTTFRLHESQRRVHNYTNINLTKLVGFLEEYEGRLLWFPNSRFGNVAFEMIQLVQDTTPLQTLLYNPEHSDRIQEFWNFTEKSLSTGLIMTSLGLSLCDEVHLYGFWPFTFDYRGNDLPMHYTENLAWSTYRKFHDFPAEFVRLIKLHYQGAVRLHVEECYSKNETDIMLASLVNK